MPVYRYTRGMIQIAAVIKSIIKGNSMAEGRLWEIPYRKPGGGCYIKKSEDKSAEIRIDQDSISGDFCVDRRCLWDSSELV